MAVNAVNSLFMSALVQPDWDMFHSQHPASLLHASARVVSCHMCFPGVRPGCRGSCPCLTALSCGLTCLVRVQISGGPVYVSDRPGKHDLDLLKRMVLPDGSVLLCSQPGRPTLDCIFADPMRDGRTLLKVARAPLCLCCFNEVPQWRAVSEARTAACRSGTCTTAAAASWASSMCRHGISLRKASWCACEERM